MTQGRAVNVAEMERLLAEMERLLRASADRCCYCQRHGATVEVSPRIPGQPHLVAHEDCAVKAAAWQRSRM